MKTHKLELKKEQNRTRTKYNSRLKSLIQFTKPIQIELSQLLWMMFNVKVHSNALESVQSNQISKLLEIANYVGRSSKQSVIKFQN